MMILIKVLVLLQITVKFIVSDDNDSYVFVCICAVYLYDNRYYHFHRYYCCHHEGNSSVDNIHLTE